DPVGIEAEIIAHADRHRTGRLGRQGAVARRLGPRDIGGAALRSVVAASRGEEDEHGGERPAPELSSGGHGRMVSAKAATAPCRSGTKNLVSILPFHSHRTSAL